jgi:hypothetical protein
MLSWKKTIAESGKLNAERQKLDTESMKLDLESRKLRLELEQPSPGEPLQSAASG